LSVAGSTDEATPSRLGDERNWDQFALPAA
jgi:hypothetical protein